MDYILSRSSLFNKAMKKQGQEPRWLLAMKTALTGAIWWQRARGTWASPRLKDPQWMWDRLWSQGPFILKAMLSSYFACQKVLFSHESTGDLRKWGWGYSSVAECWTSTLRLPGSSSRTSKRKENDHCSLRLAIYRTSIKDQKAKCPVCWYPIPSTKDRVMELAQL